MNIERVAERLYGASGNPKSFRELSAEAKAGWIRIAQESIAISIEILKSGGT